MQTSESQIMTDNNLENKQDHKNKEIHQYREAHCEEGIVMRIKRVPRETVFSRETA
jgi:hypothetical protein